jgi:hypothetical protein
MLKKEIKNFCLLAFNNTGSNLLSPLYQLCTNFDQSNINHYHTSISKKFQPVIPKLSTEIVNQLPSPKGGGLENV